MPNPNVTPNTPGLIRMARAELHRVLAAEAAQTEQHETETQEASK